MGLTQQHHDPAPVSSGTLQQQRQLLSICPNQGSTYCAVAARSEAAFESLHATGPRTPFQPTWITENSPSVLLDVSAAKTGKKPGLGRTRIERLLSAVSLHTGECMSCVDGAETMHHSQAVRPYKSSQASCRYSQTSNGMFKGTQQSRHEVCSRCASLKSSKDTTLHYPGGAATVQASEPKVSVSSKTSICLAAC